MGQKRLLARGDPGALGEAALERHRMLPPPARMRIRKRHRNLGSHLAIRVDPTHDRRQ